MITIATIIGANFCLVALRKRSSTHDQLPTDSQHSLFSSTSEHGDTGNTSTHGMPSLEDGRGHQRGGPSGLSADRIKGLLVRSASYLKDHVGRRSSLRGAGSKPTPGTRGNNQTEEYAAVRSPFTIHGEAEEGVEEDQETKNSVDDEYIRV